jgi:hypothetical protein
MAIDDTVGPYYCTVKRFVLSGEGGFKMNAQIIRTTEEGYSDPNWFGFRVSYPHPHSKCELGGT